MFIIGDVTERYLKQNMDRFMVSEKKKTQLAFILHHFLIKQPTDPPRSTTLLQLRHRLNNIIEVADIEIPDSNRFFSKTIVGGVEMPEFALSVYVEWDGCGGIDHRSTKKINT